VTDSALLQTDGAIFARVTLNRKVINIDIEQLVYLLARQVLEINTIHSHHASLHKHMSSAAHVQRCPTTPMLAMHLIPWFIFGIDFMRKSLYIYYYHQCLPFVIGELFFSFVWFCFFFFVHLPVNQSVIFISVLRIQYAIHLSAGFLTYLDLHIFMTCFVSLLHSR